MNQICMNSVNNVFFLQTARVAFLPADHELQLLSEKVLKDWESDVNKILLKYHFISSLEATGAQVSQILIHFIRFD